jgi:hypothetical protein
VFTYENGVFISLLLYGCYLVGLVVTINSTAEKNLNKVGECHSWLTLKPVSMNSADFDRPIHKTIGRFVLVALWQGCFVLLSWVNVLFAVGALVFRFSKDYGAPQNVKDFRWKIKNYDLTFDEIILEIIKLRGLNVSDFERIRVEVLEFIEERRRS